MKLKLSELDPRTGEAWSATKWDPSVENEICHPEPVSRSTLDLPPEHSSSKEIPRELAPGIGPTADHEDNPPEFTKLLHSSGLAGIVGLHGRQHELEDLLRQVRKRQSTLLMGEAGVGKTALLEQVAHEYRENCFFIRQTKPLAVLFEDLFEQLYEKKMLVVDPWNQENFEDFAHLWRGLKRLTSTAKVNVLEQIFSIHNRLVFLIDDVDQIPITAERFLRVLTERSTVIGAATNQSKSLLGIYFRMKRLTLAPVSPETIARISEAYFHKFQLNVQDERHTIKHLQRAVSGHPGPLADLLHSIRDEPQIQREHARAFQHHQGTREVNIGLLWVLSLVLIAAFRVYAMKTGNLAVVVIASAVLILIMLFRGFLLRGIGSRRS